ncbi:hypothetical protein N7510_006968 [Penicillium lagena]|uniref:uncharacterized protein n=1 Tax=Penicillium lagena TaxID=94218 RepID=UPI002540336C|nr:uncharacterized protein N7510_006968 [Penicillium lagena]KAJ5610249.1 hypothetical protein N7510_006968 [Penicillium lagena]
MTSKGMALPAHPYYPIGLEIAGYLANEWDTLTLLFIFAAGCTAIFSVTYLVVMKVHPRISPGGFIHLFLEGYYVYNFRHMPGMQDLFGQLWKVYSLSDSRYQTQDAFVLSMEAITSICWGPLSFVLALTIMTQNNLRYPFQIVVSLGQLYGDVLYYATSLFDHYILGLSYSRPEGQIFWGLFVFLNAFWVFIPIREFRTGNSDPTVLIIDQIYYTLAC